MKEVRINGIGDIISDLYTLIISLVTTIIFNIPYRNLLLFLLEYIGRYRILSLRLLNIYE